MRKRRAKMKDDDTKKAKTGPSPPISDNDDNRDGAINQTETCYSTYDQGPYFVHIQGEKLNKFRIGNLIIKENIGNIVNINKINQNTVKVHTANRETANRLIKYERWGEGVRAFIPDFYIKSNGIVHGLETDIEIDDIKKNVKCTDERGRIIIDDIERMYKWNNIEKKSEPSNSLKIVFRSQKLPEYIQIFYSKVKVSSFERRPMQCNNCMKYGHMTKKCTSPKVCSNCLQTGHEKSNCINPSKCLYCKESNHSTSSKTCLERIKQQKINDIMDKEKITFYEARKQIRSTQQFNVVNDFPRIATQSEIGTQAQPRIARTESYSEVVKIQQESNETIKKKDEQIRKLRQEVIEMNETIKKKDEQIRKLEKLCLEFKQTLTDFQETMKNQRQQQKMAMGQQILTQKEIEEHHTKPIFLYRNLTQKQEEKCKKPKQHSTNKEKNDILGGFKGFSVNPSTSNSTNKKYINHDNMDDS